MSWRILPVTNAKAADFRGSGVVTGGVLLKKDVLKTSQILQENTCVAVSF